MYASVNQSKFRSIATMAEPALGEEEPGCASAWRKWALAQPEFVMA
jgi:hypothetical protein